MNNMQAFLSQNALKHENLKYIASDRFIDENKKPIEWEICAITSTEDEQLRKSCTKYKPVPGKKHMFQNQTDYDEYNAKLMARCTVFPKLDNKELQDSYGVMGSEDLLRAMLTPGEYVDYLIKVQEVNGFEKSFDEMVDEVKN